MVGLLGTFSFGVGADAMPQREPPKSACRALGHAWQRAATESGTGQPGHADRHYICSRDGCGCKQTIAWNRDLQQWVATVTEPTDGNRKAPGA